MSTMKAMQVSKAGGPFELVERPLPEPQACQVRIKVEACGMCYSDSFVKNGGLVPISYPRIPGHEVIGVIDAIGERVHPWTVGQRVGVSWHGGHCFVCPACRRGDFINCANAKVTGISFDGGYAEYMVAPQEALVLVPTELEATETAPLLCAGVATFNAIRRSVAKPGEVVTVQGLGGLGHLAIQFANRFGFRTVAVSRGRDKEQLAYQLGADAYIDTESQDPVQELLAMGGAQVIMTTAPSGKAVESIINGLAVNGQLLTIGIYADPIKLFPTLLIMGNRSVQGFACGTAIDAEDTLRFSALRHVRPLVEVFPLERANEAFEHMMSNKARFRVVLSAFS